MYMLCVEVGLCLLRPPHFRDKMLEVGANVFDIYYDRSTFLSGKIYFPPQVLNDIYITGS